MIAVLFTAAAMAGGGGVYGEVSTGFGTSDATGIVARGTSGSLSGGVYWGSYLGSYRYGPYWRVGGFARGRSAYALGTQLENVFVPGVELVRGVDVLSFGVFGGVQVGPALVWRETQLADLFDPDASTPISTVGIDTLGFVGVAYNVGHTVSISARTRFGILYDRDGLSTNRGLSIVLTLRVPVVRRWDEEEDEGFGD